MNRKLSKSVPFAVALLAIITFAGCKREAPAAVEAPVADTSAPEVVADPQPVAEPEFSVKAFAGTFTGTLPCASCPGIDTTLVLAADGTYTLAEVYQEGKEADFNGTGTWTAEEGGTRIRLDPNSKTDEDRVFAITSNEQIDQLDKDGKPTGSELPSALKRKS